MSDPLQFTYESMPALWLCYYDPEGPVGHGKTKAEALGDLFDMCDDDHGGPLLLGAIVAAIPGDARVVAHPEVLEHIIEICTERSEFAPLNYEDAYQLCREDFDTIAIAAKAALDAASVASGIKSESPSEEGRPKYEPCTHRSGCGRVDECMAEQRCLGREEGNTDPTEYDTKWLLDALLSVYARSCTYQTRHLHDRWVELRREVERRLGEQPGVGLPAWIDPPVLHRVFEQLQKGPFAGDDEPWKRQARGALQEIRNNMPGGVCWNDSMTWPPKIEPSPVPRHGDVEWLHFCPVQERTIGTPKGDDCCWCEAGEPLNDASNVQRPGGVMSELRHVRRGAAGHRVAAYPDAHSELQAGPRRLHRGRVQGAHASVVRRVLRHPRSRVLLRPQHLRRTWWADGRAQPREHADAALRI
jgi:hypothetical protein